MKIRQPNETDHMIEWDKIFPQKKVTHENVATYTETLKHKAITYDTLWE